MRESAPLSVTSPQTAASKRHAHAAPDERLPRADGDARTTLRASKRATSSAKSHAPSRAESLRDALRALVGSRVLVWAAGVGTVLLLGFGPKRTAFNPKGLTSGFGYVGNLLAAPAARWDGAWYLTIAKYGYLPQLGHYTESRAAFFPLYPLIVGVVSRVGIAGALAGVVVSLLALLAAAYGLHRLVALELDRGGLTASWAPSRLPAPWRSWRSARSVGDASREAADKGSVSTTSHREIAALAVSLLVFSPMAFFLSADYSESLYLALSIGVFLAARHGRWAWVGVLGCLASATRSTGVVLLLPALVLYLYGPREDAAPLALDARSPTAGPVPATRESGGVAATSVGRASSMLSALLARGWRLRRPRYRLRSDALWLALIPVGLLAFIAYLWAAGGEPLAPFHSQALWGRYFAGPFVAVFDGARAAFEGARQLLSGQSSHLYFPLEGKSASIEASHNLMLFVFLALAVPACIGVLRRLPLAYGLYVLAALALPLSYPVATQPLMSLPRFELVLFPLFVWLAAQLASRPRARAVVFAAFAVALIAFTAQFSTWHWVS